MLRLARAVMIAAAILGLTGCTSRLVTPGSAPESANPPPDKARIVFYRTSIFAFALQSAVFDVTSGTPVFIGIISDDVKLAYEAPPGKRRFMVTGSAADFMDAELAPGKTYDVLVAPRYAMFKARFSLRPRRSDDPETQQQLARCTWYRSAPEADRWVHSHWHEIIARQQKFLPEFLAKESAKPMLHASDGS